MPSGSSLGTTGRIRTLKAYATNLRDRLRLRHTITAPISIAS